MKRFYSIITIIAALFTLASCNQDTPVPPEGEASKSILVYIAAYKNSLATAVSADIEEIKQGYVPGYLTGGEDKVLLVYIDSEREECPTLCRYYKKDMALVIDTLKKYPHQNSASAEVLATVINDAESFFPVKQRGLILSSHGTGWLPKGFYSNPTESVTAPDGSVFLRPAPAQMEDPYADMVKTWGLHDRYNAKAEMEICDLCACLPFHYDFIAFDACLMGGIETVYQLRDKCDFVMSSAAEILTDGYPYDTVIEPFFKMDEDGVVAAADIYYTYYEYIDTGATISVFKTSELAEVAEKSRAVFSSLERDGEGTAYKIEGLPMDKVQGYFRMGRHYFYDYLDLMERISTPEQYAELCAAWDRACRFKAATPEYKLGGHTEFRIKRFCGLSTYISNPRHSKLDSFYLGFDWNKAVGMVVE